MDGDYGDLVRDLAHLEVSVDQRVQDSTTMHQTIRNVKNRKPHHFYEPQEDEEDEGMRMW